MKTFAFAASAFLSIILASSAAPRLVVSSSTLAPESKIDLVFDLPVIETSQIGKTVENTWLDVRPSLPGKLRWKAQNIAEFLPSRSPALGESYTFSIPADRKHLDATPIPAGKIITLASDSFRVLAANLPNRWSSSYVASTAEWIIVFNDAIDPAAATPFIYFESKKGARVAAKLECATVERAGYYAEQYKPWAARWGNPPADAPAPKTLTPHILLARPVSPLPPAPGWHLTVLTGLPNAARSTSIDKSSKYDIGDIEPFRVKEIVSRIMPDQPREIVLRFNQPLPNELPADILTKNISIQPRPAELKVEVEGSQLVLTGSLTDNDQYRVEVYSNLKSMAGFPLSAGDTATLKFKHLKPQIALPSEDAGQLAHGNRQYRLFTMNLESAHLRIKNLAGDDRIRAFQGFRHFTGNGPNNARIKPTAPLPFPLIVGKTVHDKEIALGNALDTTKIITLDWNEILPKDMRCGMLFVEASGISRKDSNHNEKPITQAIIQLTDIGLAWKTNDKEALIYAFSCQTGAPLPGVKLQLFGEDATTLQSATTDTSGLATLPRMANARHLQATLGADAYITAYDSTLQTVGLWHFPVHYSWNKPAEFSRQAMLFTDRSLYRPGETFRLKGIIRTLHGNTLEAAKTGPARIVILDPEEKEISSSPVTISANGSFDYSHTLPAGKIGTHLIRLEFTKELEAVKATADNEGSEESTSDMSWSERENVIANARFEIPLRVEEFRRNAFEITQEIAAPTIGATSVTANLSAKYYQGQSVAAGGVKYYSKVTSRNPYPERFRDYLFGNHRTYDYGYWYHYFGYKDDEGNSTGHSNQLEGEAFLSTDGKASLLIKIPEGDFPCPHDVVISSEVTDANNQTLTSEATATVQSSSVYVGISRSDSLANVGKEYPLKIVAIDSEERPYTRPLKLTATVTREVNSAIRSQTDSGATTTRNDVAEETVQIKELTLDPSASAHDGQPFLFTPKSPGLHYLTLRGNDPEGRPFTTVTYFYVYGTNEYPWQYEDGLRIKLVAEKKSYKPGETARVLVLSPIEGTALVTVEREKVLRSFLIPLKADNPVIEIPLTDADAPNAYVSVLIVKGAQDSARQFKQPQLRLGICELRIEDQRDKLHVAFDPRADSYRPGEEVTLSGIVSLPGGKPAAGAEVTLYAEDEGTLAVMGYETPDPMACFYAPRNLLVDAGTSFASFIAEDPSKQTFNTKGMFVGGGGDLGKLADLMRKNFDPCATWAPVLMTDASGKFSHHFKLPDTLTRYRVIAIAHHETTRFGMEETAIVAKKDLMLEVKAPRFANQTDTFNPQVLVQNASQFTGTWQIQYNAHDAAGTPVCRVIGSNVATVTLAPGASTAVVFPTKAETMGDAVLTWKATPVSLTKSELTPQLSHQLSDAVESRFQVVYPMPMIHQVKFVKLDRPGAQADLRKVLDGSLLDGEGTLDLEISDSPLVDAAGSIDYLLHYPYGCVEQSTSSLIPWCTVASLKRVIPTFASLPEKRVQSAIQAGADRLISMQLSNGGFTYWPGGTEEVDWLSSYAGLGLLMAVGSGAIVPDTAITNLKQHLIEGLRGLAEIKSPSALECQARSLFVLALAGEPQPAYQNALSERLKELTPSARAMLATAVAMTKKDDGSNLAQARGILTSSVSFTAEYDGWMTYMPDRAMELIAWDAISPDGPEATAALTHMFEDRNPYGHWRTTWVNGWSLVAMARYAEHEKNRAETVNLKFDTNGGTDAIQLTTDAPTAMRNLRLGPNLKLDITADHLAYVRLRVVSKPPVTPIQPVAKNGLSVDRIYDRVNADGSVTPLTEPKVGDLIRVSLRVTLPGDHSRYLVIDDPLPAIFETVNNDFKSQSNGLGISTSDQGWNVSHSELRSDRAIFFFDDIDRSNNYTLTYLARCTLAGQGIAPPAKVESMYDPDNYALSASRVFNTK